MKARRRSARVAANVALLVVAVAFLGPLAWMIVASFDGQATLSIRGDMNVTGANYGAVLSWDVGGEPLLNSFLMSFFGAAITLVAAVLCAYPLSRYQLRFRRPFLYGVLFATCWPITAILVPVYTMFVRLDLIDSLPATTVFLSTAQLPLAIWMAKNFIDSVPVSLEEAAWVDGASPMQALRTIVVPLMLPGIAVVAIFNFIQIWGNYFVPFVLLIDTAKMPASVSLFTFFGQNGLVAYGQLAAYSVLYTAPVVLLYLIISRALGRGFTLAGAVKA